MDYAKGGLRRRICFSFHYIAFRCLLVSFPHVLRQKLSYTRWKCLVVMYHLLFFLSLVYAIELGRFFGSRYLTGFVPGMSCLYLVYCCCFWWSTNYFQLADVWHGFFPPFTNCRAWPTSSVKGKRNAVVWMVCLVLYLSS